MEKLIELIVGLNNKLLDNTHQPWHTELLIGSYGFLYGYIAGKLTFL